MTVINYTIPGTFTFIVPAGVTQLQFDVRGAGGGAYGGGYGGKGGRVVGRKTVTPGDTITLVVGGKGAAPSGHNGGLGGSNGGARGGNATGSGGQAGAGGGGASDIRYGGVALANRICVAGGGGGAGRYDPYKSKAPGGKGGAAVGQAGTGYATGHGGGGGGGTAAAGGAAGAAGTGGGAGAVGTSGAGGRGNDSGTKYAKTGGGGGGGFFGGGGGGGTTNKATSGSGGGGSSYTGGLDTVVSNVQGAGSAAGANGLIILTYGVVWTAGGYGGDPGSIGVGDHPGAGGTQTAGGAGGAGGGSYTAGGAGTYGQGGTGSTGGGGGGGGGLFGGGGGAWNTTASPQRGGTGGGGSNFGGDLVDANNTPAPDGSVNGYARITYNVPAVAVIADPLVGAGNQITGDHQYQFNGLLFGSGTNYMSEGWNGLFDAVPNVASNDLTPQDRHGVIPGLDLLGGRTMDNVIDIKDDDRTSTSTIFDRAEALQSAFRVRQNEVPLVYQLPGRAKRFIMARPRKASMPKDADLTLGLGKASIQLFASDPAHYDLASSGFTALQRTNLILNPGAEVDTNWWEDGGNCTLARSTAQFTVGAASFQMTATAAGDMSMETTAIGQPIVAGKTYALQLKAKSAVTARNVQAQITWIDINGDSISTSSSIAAADSSAGWTLNSIAVAAPTGAVDAVVLATVIGCALNEVHFIDAVLFEQAATVGTYFDGSTAATGTAAFDWAGTAGESMSYQYDLNYYMPAGVTSMEFDFVVDGTWFTKPIISIDGVGNGWKIEVLEQDDMDGESDVGSTWAYKAASDPTVFTGTRHNHVVDMVDQTYTLDTVVSYQLLDFASDWWRLFPGMNKIRVSRNDNAYSDTYSAAISMSWHTARMY